MLSMFINQTSVKANSIYCWPEIYINQSFDYYMYTLMTNDMPSNSPTLYVLIGSVKSIFKVDFGNGRKTNELRNPHKFNVLHQMAQTVSIYSFWYTAIHTTVLD